MLRIALYVCCWAFVIYGLVTYDPESGPRCNYDLCPYCPFPCDERHG